MDRDIRDDSGEYEIGSAEDVHLSGSADGTIEKAQDVTIENGEASFSRSEDVSVSGGNTEVEQCGDVFVEGGTVIIESAEDVNVESEDADVTIK